MCKWTHMSKGERLGGSLTMMWPEMVSWSGSFGHPWGVCVNGWAPSPFACLLLQSAAPLGTLILIQLASSKLQGQLIIAGADPFSSWKGKVQKGTAAPSDSPTINWWGGQMPPRWLAIRVIINQAVLINTSCFHQYVRFQVLLKGSEGVRTLPETSGVLRKAPECLGGVGGGSILMARGPGMRLAVPNSLFAYKAPRRLNQVIWSLSFLLFAYKECHVLSFCSMLLLFAMCRSNIC